MTSLHDIYDSAPLPAPPRALKPERLTWTHSDVFILCVLGSIVALLAAAAWLIDESLGVLAGLGGGLVIIESWITGLSYLQRHPVAGRKLRWVTFFAALVPWIVGLGVAASFMLLLFRLTDSFN